MKQLLFSLILASIGCGTTSPTGPVLYAYGDSVTYGVYTQHISYVNDIAVQIGYQVANSAVPGTTISSPNQYPLLMSDPWIPGSIVFFTPGANDSSNAGDSVYTAQYEQYLLTILTKAASLPITFYLGTPIPPLVSSPGGWSADDIEMFAELNRQAVKTINSPNVILIDFNAQYIPTAVIDADSYHPNALGYDLMTQIFFGKMGN